MIVLLLLPSPHHRTSKKTIIILSFKYSHEKILHGLCRLNPNCSGHWLMNCLRHMSYFPQHLGNNPPRISLRPQSQSACAFESKYDPRYSPRSARYVTSFYCRSIHSVYCDLLTGFTVILYTVIDLVHSKHCEFEAAEHRNTANQALIHGVYYG